MNGAGKEKVLIAGVNALEMPSTRARPSCSTRAQLLFVHVLEKMLGTPTMRTASLLPSHIGWPTVIMVPASLPLTGQKVPEHTSSSSQEALVPTAVPLLPEMTAEA